MKTNIFTFLITLTCIFVLLTLLDIKNGTYTAERDLWFLKKDFQSIYDHATSIPERTINDFVKKCQHFLAVHPQSILGQEVQKYMKNALILKSAMTVNGTGQF